MARKLALDHFNKLQKQFKEEADQRRFVHKCLEEANEFYNSTRYVTFRKPIYHEDVDKGIITCANISMLLTSISRSHPFGE